MQTIGRPQQLQLVIEKAEVERGIVRDERRIAEELDQLLDPVRKQWLVRTGRCR